MTEIKPSSGWCNPPVAQQSWLLREATGANKGYAKPELGQHLTLRNNTALRGERLPRHAGGVSWRRRLAGGTERISIWEIITLFSCSSSPKPAAAPVSLRTLSSNLTPFHLELRTALQGSEFCKFTSTPDALLINSLASGFGVIILR